MSRKPEQAEPDESAGQSRLEHHRLENVEAKVSSRATVLAMAKGIPGLFIPEVMNRLGDELTQARQRIAEYKEQQEHVLQETIINLESPDQAAVDATLRSLPTTLRRYPAVREEIAGALEIYMRKRLGKPWQPDPPLQSDPLLKSSLTLLVKLRPCADLSSLDLRYARFDDCRLHRASFQDSVLHRATFARADITEANFDRADLTDCCDLSGARNHRPSQFSDARTDPSTKLPPQPSQRHRLVARGRTLSRRRSNVKGSKRLPELPDGC